MTRIEKYIAFCHSITSHSCELLRRDITDHESASQFAHAVRNLSSLNHGNTPYYKNDKMGHAYISRYHVPHALTTYMFIDQFYDHFERFGEGCRIIDINAGTASATLGARRLIKRGVNEALVIEMSDPMWSPGKELVERFIEQEELDLSVARDKRWLTSIPEEAWRKTLRDNAVYIASHPFPYPKDDEDPNDLVENYVESTIQMLWPSKDAVGLFIVNPKSREKDNFSKSQFLDRIAERAEEEMSAGVIRVQLSAFCTSKWRDALNKELLPLQAERNRIKAIAGLDDEVEWMAPYLNTNSEALILYWAGE